jgi:hypothetical protein
MRFPTWLDVISNQRQQLFLFRNLTAGHVVDPDTQVVQTECIIQFAVLYYSDLDSGEVFEDESVLFKLNVGNGVVTNAVEDQNRFYGFGLAVSNLPELVFYEHGVRGPFQTWLDGERHDIKHERRVSVARPRCSDLDLRKLDVGV